MVTLERILVGIPERILVPIPTSTSRCQPLEVFSPVVLEVCDAHVQLCLGPVPHSIYLVPSLESSGAHWKTPVHLFGVHWVLSHVFVLVSLPWYLKLLACLLGSLFLHFDIHLRCWFLDLHLSLAQVQLLSNELAYNFSNIIIPNGYVVNQPPISLNLCYGLCSYNKHRLLGTPLIIAQDGNVACSSWLVPCLGEELKPFQGATICLLQNSSSSSFFH